ncbi:MAG: aminoglycoside phosphotransferase [Gammaproteobacteria bacterium HGW-Gammaproteobacteria-8]|nr:MAG: aminoglycoside phosphotransferase [Gammaproteobacteria bacterium HGW-Gammaproteobacteria-8]
MNLTDDERARAAREWAARCCGWNDADFAPASADASFRRYFRLSRAGDSRIVMDAPPQDEPLDAFIDVRGRLSRAGLRVPEILAEDRSRGFLLLEDFGNQPWHRVLDESNAGAMFADAMFADAIAALIQMQSRADTDGLPDYDAALLLRELELFPEWFLGRHWGVQATENELDQWELVCMSLLRWALDQPRVFCHRDFMPRNLMLCTPNPGILDFQDAVRGPISYDPVCLFRDAFIGWPPERVDGWLEGYRQRALAAGLPVPQDPELWRRTCDLMGAQRHLKVLGIFARIRYRDGKPQYLEDAPRFFGYLERASARNPELAPLTELFSRWRSRAQARQ